MRAAIILLGVMLAFPAVAAGPHPPCDGEDNWAAAMVGVYLKNNGLADKAGGYDTLTVERLASEPLADGLFRQVHKVTIVDGGKRFTAITVNTASHQECSESPVEVYLVSSLYAQASPRVSPH